MCGSKLAFNHVLPHIMTKPFIGVCDIEKSKSSNERAMRERESEEEKK